MIRAAGGGRYGATMVRRGTVTTAAVTLATAMMVVFGAVGCGDDDADGADADGDGGSAGDTDGSALVAPFDDAAEAAYEAAGADRREDFTRGVTIDEGCFVLSDEAVVAVAEAIGVEGAGDAEVNPGTFLTGPPGQRESLVCSIGIGEDDANVSVNTGTTPLDRDGLLEEFELFADSNDVEVQQLDGEAPGLDPDDVLAVEREGVASFSWVRDDFQISLSVPTEVADAEAGFRALPVLVEGVTDTLSGG